jgi:hypothetical protein
MRTIRASELTTFAFCQRAWWYQRRGEPSQNTRELADGLTAHQRHGAAVLQTGCLRALAYGLLLLAIVLLVSYATLQWL